MTDKIDEQPTPTDHKEFEKRSGKDRRKVHTMINPDKDSKDGRQAKKENSKKTINR